MEQQFSQTTLNISSSSTPLKPDSTTYTKENKFKLLQHYQNHFNLKSQNSLATEEKLQIPYHNYINRDVLRSFDN